MDGGCNKGSSCPFLHSRSGNQSNNQSRWDGSPQSKQNTQGKSDTYPDIPSNCPVRLTNHHNDKKWFWTLADGSGRVFADLSAPPLWVFTCYNMDAKPENPTNNHPNDLSGDYSPEEIRWETYKANAKGELNPMLEQINKTAQDYWKNRTTTVENCSNRIQEHFKTKPDWQQERMNKNRYNNNNNNFRTNTTSNDSSWGGNNTNTNKSYRGRGNSNYQRNRGGGELFALEYAY